jgi:hypothetical protein
MYVPEPWCLLFMHQHYVLLLCADPVTGAAPYVRTFACSTEVCFDDLPKELIDAYIASGGGQQRDACRCVHCADGT